MGLLARWCLMASDMRVDRERRVGFNKLFLRNTQDTQVKIKTITCPLVCVLIKFNDAISQLWFTLHCTSINCTEPLKCLYGYRRELIVNSSTPFSTFLENTNFEWIGPFQLLCLDYCFYLQGVLWTLIDTCQMMWSCLMHLMFVALQVPHFFYKCCFSRNQKRQNPKMDFYTNRNRYHKWGRSSEY